MCGYIRSDRYVDILFLSRCVDISGLTRCVGILGLTGVWIY